MCDPDDPVFWAKSTRQAQYIVQQLGVPTHLFLDHDLGGDDTALVFLKWLEEQHPNMPPTYSIHSSNPAGAANLKAFMDTWRRLHSSSHV